MTPLCSVDGVGYGTVTMKSCAHPLSVSPLTAALRAVGGSPCARRQDSPLGFPTLGQAAKFTQVDVSQRLQGSQILAESHVHEPGNQKCPPLTPLLPTSLKTQVTTLLGLVPTRPLRFGVIFLSGSSSYADHKPLTAPFCFFYFFSSSFFSPGPCTILLTWHLNRQAGGGGLVPRPQFGLKSLILTRRQDAVFILKEKDPVQLPKIVNSDVHLGRFAFGEDRWRLLLRTTVSSPTLH